MIRLYFEDIEEQAMGKQWRKVGAVFLVGALLIRMVRQARENNVKIHKWTSPTFHSQVPPLRFFFITDVHRRIIAEELLESIKGKCDFIIIGGDFTEKGVPKKRTEDNLARLVQLGPVLFVNGNNDDEVDQDWLNKLLNRSGAVHLNDQMILLNQGALNIRLIGLAHRHYTPELLNRLFGDSEADYTIVICHYPDASRFLSGRKVDLMLSGHTHGGQIRFGQLGLRPHGHVTTDEGFLKLVSNGYGTTRIPLRLGAKPETHLITLSSK